MHEIYFSESREMVRILSVLHTYLALTSGDKTNEKLWLVNNLHFSGKFVHAVKIPLRPNTENANNLHPLCSKDRICLRKNKNKKKTTSPMKKRNKQKNHTTKCFQGNIDNIYRAAFILVTSGASFEVLTEMISPFIRWFLQKTHGLPHHLGGSSEIGDFFSPSHTSTVL